MSPARRGILRASEVRRGSDLATLQRAYELIDLFVEKFNVDYQHSVDIGSDSLFTQALMHLNTAVGIQPRRLETRGIAISGCSLADSVP